MLVDTGHVVQGGWASVSDTSPKSIERERLGESRAGTRQGRHISQSKRKTQCNFRFRLL